MILTKNRIVLPSGAPAFQTGDSAGSTLVSTEGQKSTFRGTFFGPVTAATATDIFTITGSSSKLVKVTKVGLYGQQTTHIVVAFDVLKRGTANAGGTFTTPTIMPMDSVDAPTAVVRAYTVNPTTLGTGLGTAATIEVFISAAADLIAMDRQEIVFGNTPGSKPVVLRGTNQLLAINARNGNMTGNFIHVFFEWTEE